MNVNYSIYSKKNILMLPLYPFGVTVSDAIFFFDKSNTKSQITETKNNRNSTMRGERSKQRWSNQATRMFLFLFKLRMLHSNKCPRRLRKDKFHKESWQVINARALRTPKLSILPRIGGRKCCRDTISQHFPRLIGPRLIHLSAHPIEASKTNVHLRPLPFHKAETLLGNARHDISVKLIQTSKAIRVGDRNTNLE